MVDGGYATTSAATSTMVSDVRANGSTAEARVVPGLVAGDDATLTRDEYRATRDRVRRALYRNPFGVTTQALAAVAGLSLPGQRYVLVGMLRGRMARNVVRVFVRAPLAECGQREPWTISGRPGGRRSLWFHAAHAANAIERAYKDTPPGQWHLQTRDIVRLATGGT